MNFEEMVPTQKDFELIMDTLETQDVLKNLGECKDYMDEEGFCKMCTALQRLQSLILLMQDEDAWIGAK